MFFLQTFGAKRSVAVKAYDNPHHFFGDMCVISAVLPCGIQRVHIKELLIWGDGAAYG